MLNTRRYDWAKITGNNLVSVKHGRYFGQSREFLQLAAHSYTSSIIDRNTRCRISMAEVETLGMTMTATIPSHGIASVMVAYAATPVWNITYFFPIIKNKRKLK